MNHRILLVDDEIDILEFISYNLQKEGYEIFTAENGVDALKLAEQHHPHLILLDMMMPVMDGIQTCAAIRAHKSLKNTMVVFLSALGEEEQQLAGFDAGADYYITKPIKIKLLTSRIQAILKRVETKQAKRGLSIDREHYIVRRGDEEIFLPKKEFALLELLYAAKGKLISRDDIYKKVWGDEVVVGDRTIDVHIRKLRKKLGEEYITTVKGIGYKFEMKK